MAQQAGPPGQVGGNMAVPPGWTPMGQTVPGMPPAPNDPRMRGWGPMGGPPPHAGGFSPEQAMMMNQAQRAPESLGLGLGLNAGQRAGWMQAAQQGQGASWLGEHKAVAKKVNRVNPESAQASRIQRFVGSGTPQSRLEATKR